MIDSARPKSTPDAMEEYVTRLREIGDWLVAKENVHDASALYSIARALAAPVPSPGGAPSFAERNLIARFGARARDAMQRGFMTACAGDGQYQIIIDFETLEEMQAAHTDLAELLR